MDFLIMGIYSVIMTVYASTGLSLSPPVPSSTSSSVRTSSTLQGTSKRHKLDSHGQWLLRQISTINNQCQVQETHNLQRKMLKTSDVSCNDGSPAGYYIRRSQGSDKWIVFLEGGWYCFDHISCSERFRVMRDYMSSKNWPKYRSGIGFLSWDPEENPYYFHSNVVYVPYCSSDSWSGTRNKTSVMDFSFMGSLILDKIFKELLRKGMNQAKTVILTGTSAGGTGVLINLDRIADMIASVEPSIQVLGVVDAGWFLDNEPFKSKPCRDSFTCSPMAGIQKGTRVWEPRLPKNCTAQYPTEIWRCFFGHRVYPSMKYQFSFYTRKHELMQKNVFHNIVLNGPIIYDHINDYAKFAPVYIIQNMYDSAQIQVNNVFEENTQGQLTSEQWRYLLNLGEEMQKTLQNVSAVFSPGCVAHEILTKPEWYRLYIDGTSLPESIHCWVTSHSIHLACPQSSTNSLITKNDTSLSDEPPTSQDKRTRRIKGKQKWKNGKKSGNTLKTAHPEEAKTDFKLQASLQEESKLQAQDISPDIANTS